MDESSSYLPLLPMKEIPWPSWWHAYKPLACLGNIISLDHARSKGYILLAQVEITKMARVYLLLVPDMGKFSCNSLDSRAAKEQLRLIMGDAVAS